VALVSINIVTLQRIQLVPEWHFRMDKPPGQHRTRHTGRLSQSHLSVGRQNEYWLWLRPPLGKNDKSCITVGPVTRTANILAYSRLKVLAVNGFGHGILPLTVTLTLTLSLTVTSNINPKPK